MSEYQGQHSIRYPSCVFNYNGRKLISIGYEGELYVSKLSLKRTCENLLGDRGFMCSECEYVERFVKGDVVKQPNFCPQCGAEVVDA